MQKFIEMLRNWKTTLAGIVPLIVGLLVAFGVVDVSPNEVNDAVGETLESLIGLLMSASGLGLIFSKDADK